MKVGDLVRYKDSIRDDVGIIMEIQSEGSFVRSLDTGDFKCKSL